MTQAQLASDAGVSRASVGALERGHHMPAVDAAVRLARALGTTVELLFAEQSPPLAVADVVGGRLADGALVRAAVVGETTVATTVDGSAALTGAAADGVMVGGRVAYFSGAAACGAVAVGCDPLLRVAEGLLGHAGPNRLVAVPATSGQARVALRQGRSHAGLVHGPAGTLDPPPGLRRWHVASWRSGVASHPALGGPSVEALLGGELELAGRAESAACQQALARAADRLGTTVPSSVAIAGGHVEAARWASDRRAAAVTIEPVALAAGLDFLALEVHDVELWVPERWLEVAGIAAFLDLLTSSRFLDRARALPAYDLSSTGTTA